MADTDKEALEREVPLLLERFQKSSPEELLGYFIPRFGKRIALASSLGKEDQVLLDMIMKIDRNARIFTIDTGRLCPETYNLIATDEDYYKIKLEVFFPDRAKVEEYVRTYGINGFYAGLRPGRPAARQGSLSRSGGRSPGLMSGSAA